MNNNKQSRQLPPKIGLFGGTFNPLHKGHLQVAKDVRQQFELDVIHLIPCALPPHKTTGPLAKAAHRLEMINLALADQQGFEVSDIEIQRQGTSYTWDTIQHYKAIIPPATRLYFIVGLDAFIEIHTWKYFSQLFDEVAFIVMGRPGVATEFSAFIKTILEYVQTHICSGYRLGDDNKMLRHTQKQPIYLASVTPVDIASSQIRHMISKGESIEPWVTPPVARYIEKKGLYL